MYPAQGWLLADAVGRQQTITSVFTEVIVVIRISLDVLERLDGGGRGIRTPVTRQGKAVFKTACFNHSHIPPRVGMHPHDSDARD
jgi:hypothetical protein